MTTANRHFIVVASVLAGLTLVACARDGSSATGPGRASSSVSLSFTTMTAGAALGQRNSAIASLVRSDFLNRQRAAGTLAIAGNDTLIITKAQVVLARLELSSSTSASCDDDSSEPGCEDVERSLVLVDLPTDTTVRTVVNATIPPGTYSSLEGKLRAAHKTDDANASQFLTAHPQLQGANVRVEGTFRGAAFVYTGTTEGRLELDFSPPMVVD